MNSMQLPGKLGSQVIRMDIIDLGCMCLSPLCLGCDNDELNTKSHCVQLPSLHSRWLCPPLRCHSKTLPLPTTCSSSIIGRKKKKYGGVLPSILRSLELEDDIEKTLNLFVENLGPKEQTIILREQGSCERVIRVFEWFKSQNVYVPNVIHYNVVLRALGKAQQWDKLRLYWIEMAKNRVLPTNNTYSMLIDVYGKSGLVKESLLWIKHMKLRGYFPDEVTMSTVVKVLKDAGEFDRADRFYKDWCAGRVELNDLGLDSMTDTQNGLSFKHFLSSELFKTGGRIPANSRYTENSPQKPRLTSTFNTLIDLYGKAGQLRDAADVFADMLKSGVALDAFTFNTMIFICGSHGDLLEAEYLLSKMEERGISPDTKTYNILLSLYANVGNIDAALSCYRRIREVGLFPDAVTYRALLGALCKENMVQAVDALLDEMEKSSVSVDEHSLPVIIKMYINKRALDKANELLQKFLIHREPSSKICAAIMDAFAEKRLWIEAENFFYRRREMVGLTRDVVEYNVMIKAYGKAKCYDKAISLFKEMRNQGTWPDECTYNSLIQMLSRKGSADFVDLARELRVEMQEMGLKPHCQTFSAVIECHARCGRLSDAVSVYQEMRRAGVKPNEFVYGSLINGFAEYGSLEDALQYLHMMEESGLSANLVVLTSLLKSYCKVGNLEGAKAIYERMRDLEGGPDVFACNSMMGLYAYFDMVSEAKLIFENLREKGWANAFSYVMMMTAYRNVGMFDEAIEIAEEMKLSGLLRSRGSFHVVLVCYAITGQLKVFGELIHQMISRKRFPRKRTFKVLFSVLKKGGFPIEAMDQIRSSFEERKPYAIRAALTALYSVVGMHTLALESAKKFLDSEAITACNVAIYAYGSAGEVDKALNIYMKMRNKGLEPDLVTYINLVICYGKAGMVEGVKRVYSQLEYGDIEPSESLFQAIINAYTICNRKDLAAVARKEMSLTFYSDQDSENDSHQDSELETENDLHADSDLETEHEGDKDPELDTDYDL